MEGLSRDRVGLKTHDPPLIEKISSMYMFIYIYFYINVLKSLKHSSIFTVVTLRKSSKILGLCMCVLFEIFDHDIKHHSTYPSVCPSIPRDGKNVDWRRIQSSFQIKQKPQQSLCVAGLSPSMMLLSEDSSTGPPRNGPRCIVGCDPAWS